MSGFEGDLELELEFPDDDTFVDVYAGGGEKLFGQEEPGTLYLRRGLYRVRATRGGRIHEEVIRLTESVHHKVKGPAMYSAIPMEGTITSRESHMAVAACLANDTLTADLPTSSASPARLMVLVRVPAGAARGVELVTPEGETVVLGDHSEEGDGCLGFSTKVDPGFCRLRLNGMQIAVHVFPGWSTQVFLSGNADGPWLETASMFFSRANDVFEPRDEAMAVADLALKGLQNNHRTLSRRERRHLLKDKFSNFFLGVVAVHFLLRRMHGPSQLDDIVSNLEHLAPESPDVQALRIELDRRTGRARDREPLSEPPMLVASLDLVVQAASEGLVEIVRESELERAMEAGVRVSPWNMWSAETVSAISARERAELVQRLVVEQRKEEERGLQPGQLRLRARTARYSARREEAVTMVPDTGVGLVKGDAAAPDSGGALVDAGALERLQDMYSGEEAVPEADDEGDWADVEGEWAGDGSGDEGIAEDDGMDPDAVPGLWITQAVALLMAQHDELSAQDVARALRVPLTRVKDDFEAVRDMFQRTEGGRLVEAFKRH